MKWFKHDTDANQDAKLQNVLLDYGLEGYGLYWYCIEQIAGKVDQDNINFDLEHDARIIARNTGSTAQKVEEMMRYFVNLGLFESSSGVITCMKLAKRLDKSMTSNPQMRDIIENLKSHDGVMIQSPNIMQDKIRLDQNRIDNKELLSSKHDAIEILKYMNEIGGTSFRTTTESHLKHISARLNEGATIEDCKAVIDFKYKDWKGTTQAQYFRPQTLFQPGKFDGYLSASKLKAPRDLNSIGKDFKKPEGFK
ncbi:hypothetical protein VPAG_00046 [Vibrio phage douglas 12A4]|uniref:hypothetical protein n=1 Tax=Vibrio phage douglas 12A4 TaxID=573171 RepID=UPI0002C151AA|nr:hypothetical protein VPAG_00046 [Vibrio phage douglas 12A4]AGG58082.1 hypothetical protein VPAG_00046 [Vibrio phage douglas 12A4]